MCLLALFFRVVEDAPVVAAGNREEAYARGGEPPQVFDERCRFVAGRDPVAGGTWFGVNQHGVLVAVTNRRKTQPQSQPRSRGLLARELLGCPTAAAASNLATRELGANPYAGCNILCADSERAIVLHAGDWLRVRPLPPGLHVITNHDVNDVNDRRLVHALTWLGQRRYSASYQCLAALKELCAQTGNGTPPICIHGKEGGTVASSIVALRSPLNVSTYLHAQGPPDRIPYADYGYLVRELARAAAAGG
jgi:uncharacterized protein with NRDE domain